MDDRREAIAWLATERVWPYLVIRDAEVLPRLIEYGYVGDAVAAGQLAAERVSRDHPRASVDDVLADLGVDVVESDAPPKVAWTYRRSQYRGRPPRVIVYRRALTELRTLVADADLAWALPADRIRDLMLSHELYHHLAFSELGRVSDRLRLPSRFGPFTVRRRILTLDEVAAHAFAQRFCGLSVAPVVLDWLTLYRDSVRFDSFLQRVHNLVDQYDLLRMGDYAQSL